MTTRYGNRFPGRLLGGVTLILGPLLWTAGLALRWLPFGTGVFTSQELDHLEARPFALTGELYAYDRVPGLVTAGYATFLLGIAVLLPAFLTLAQIGGRRHPRLAWWGGLGVGLGLLAHFFFSGVEQTAFQLSDEYGPRRTLDFVTANYADVSYGPWHIPVTASVGMLLGTALLAFAAYRSGTFGTVRCLLLLLPFAGVGMGMGVLKGSEPDAVIGAALACVVLVPLGVQVLRDKVPAGEPRLLSW